MIYRIAAVFLMLVFYGAYFLKMLLNSSSSMTPLLSVSNTEKASIIVSGSFIILIKSKN